MLVYLTGEKVKLKIFISLIMLLMPVLNIFESETEVISYSYVDSEIYEAFRVVETKKGPYTGKNIDMPVIKTYKGPMTAYGPDCVGCIGITSSGYNVLNGNIFYKDKTFGNIRILAADRSLPFGTIVRINGLKAYPESIIAIVLDRGSAIGFNKRSYFDLLYESERDTLTFGCQYATFDILRIGY